MSIENNSGQVEVIGIDIIVKTNNKNTITSMNQNEGVNISQSYKFISGIRMKTHISYRMYLKQCVAKDI